MPHLNESLASFTHAQRDRLAYIELRLRFVGEVQRGDLVQRFGIQTAAATRDFTLYKELAPANVHYDASSKRYVLAPGFRPLFELPLQRVFSFLTQGFGDGEPTSAKAWVTSDSPGGLSRPNLDVLATVTRAISAQCALVIDYHSVSSGPTQREIAPFALIDTGLRWHVRAFDRRSGEFRDFVISRIQNPSLLAAGELQAHERPDQDIQWTRIVELELVPHPGQPQPAIARLDYGMDDGVLMVKLRAATAGYTLRKWNIDCSPDHSLSGPEYQLWLRNPLALYGVKSAVLAPGYEAVDSGLAAPPVTD
jgi:hypothetical protein